MSTVVAENLTKVYDDKLVAVDAIDFVIQPGEVFGFLGPNGAGKSTTISMITGILKPTSGSLTVLGKEMPQNYKDVQKQIGYVPQDLVFYDHLSVMENLTLFGRAYDVEDIDNQISNAVHLMGLEDLVDRQAESLSGGQKRRLNTAMGLLNSPDLLILDEPSAGMDPQSRNVLWESIQQMSKEDITIILTTHLMETADALSDRVCIIDHGKIQAIDTPDNLKRTIGEGDLIELDIDTTVSEDQEIKIKNTLEKYNGDAKIRVLDNSLLITINDGVNALADILPPIREILGKEHIQNVGLRDNTLEDVFIDLTGRRLRE